MNFIFQIKSSLTNMFVILVAICLIKGKLFKQWMLILDVVVPITPIGANKLNTAHKVIFIYSYWCLFVLNMCVSSLKSHWIGPQSGILNIHRTVILTCHFFLLRDPKYSARFSCQIFFYWQIDLTILFHKYEGQWKNTKTI